MKDSWQKIENWIQKNHPAMFDTLNPAATAEDLLQLESSLGKQLPEDFKSFLSIHNGQVWTNLYLFDGHRLLSTSEILQEWSDWNKNLPLIDKHLAELHMGVAKSDPDIGIKDDWWNSSWIPITENGSGDPFCIDLDPTSEGTYGQIIKMWHNVPWRNLEANSFREWINTYVRDLENGLYIPSDDMGWGGIVRKEYDE